MDFLIYLLQSDEFILQHFSGLCTSKEALDRIAKISKKEFKDE